MVKLHLCQYANCDERTALPVIVTHKGERTKRYCSDAHAAAALLRRQNYRWVWLLVLLLPMGGPRVTAMSNVEHELGGS